MQRRECCLSVLYLAGSAGQVLPGHTEPTDARVQLNVKRSLRIAREFPSPVGREDATADDLDPGTLGEISE